MVVDVMTMNNLLSDVQELGNKLADVEAVLTGLMTHNATVETAKAKEEIKELNLDDVRKLCTRKARVSLENTEAVKAIFEAHGAKKLSAIDPVEYGAIIQEVEGLPDA